MILQNILENMDYDVIQGDLDKNILALNFDSRKRIESSLFICITGFIVDGHDKAEEAIQNGAVALLVEKDVSVPKEITVIKVKSTRDGMAKVASNFYGHPSQTLNVIGITGTNGKTSITKFLKAILDEARHKTGVIGTLGVVMNDQLIPTNNTTPEAVDLQRFLYDMKESNHDYCLIEVSSHSLQLKRVSHMSISTGIFTNLTPDHLELHKTMEDYFEAKTKLFEMVEQTNIVNADDFYGQQLIKQLESTNVKTVSYGIHGKADFYATDIDYSFDGTTYTLHTPFESTRIKVNLPGDIYVSNSLAAIAAAYNNGIPLEVVKSGIEKVQQIEGRMEKVYEEGDFKVIVDFAHTEDALQQTLHTLRPFVKGRIILVFGVYADMSESGTNKRYGMGRVAAEYADVSIVTLDNPKNHDVDTIIREITDAIERNNGEYVAIKDRKEAIEHAIAISQADDCILLAGKGHETAQLIGDQEIEFSEKAIVLEAMKTKTFD